MRAVAIFVFVAIVGLVSLLAQAKACNGITCLQAKPEKAGEADDSAPNFYCASIIARCCVYESCGWDGWCYPWCKVCWTEEACEPYYPCEGPMRTPSMFYGVGKIWML